MRGAATKKRGAPLCSFIKKIVVIDVMQARKADLFLHPGEYGCLVVENFHLQEAAVLSKKGSPAFNH
jgi:hypothetical protein